MYTERYKVWISLTKRYPKRNDTKKVTIVTRGCYWLFMAFVSKSKVSNFIHHSPIKVKQVDKVLCKRATSSIIWSYLGTFLTSMLLKVMKVFTFNLKILMSCMLLFHNRFELFLTQLGFLVHIWGFWFRIRKDDREITDSNLESKEEITLIGAMVGEASRCIDLFSFIIYVSTLVNILFFSLINVLEN